MLRWTLLSICCLLYATNSTLADIEVWEGNAANCMISDVDNTIEIEAAGTYGFRAWNGDPESPVLEEIQDLFVDASVTGTVTVSVAYDAGGNNGATDIWELDLTGGSGTGNLDDLRISGDLGTVSTVVCDNVTGTVTCVNVDNGITIETSLTGSGSITGSGDIAGTVTIVNGRLDGSLTANMLGDVSLQALVGLVQHNGSISVTSESQEYAGTMSISRAFWGSISFADDVSGTLSLAPRDGCTIEIGGTLSGGITLIGYIGGDISVQDLSGEIHTAGYLGGWPSLRAAKDGGAIFLSRRVA